MGKLEGIIILSADGRPIVHSHFANSIPTYPLLHTDYLTTLLSSIAATNAQLSSHHAGGATAATSASSSASAASGSSSSAATTKQLHPSRLTSAKDIKPVLWVPGIPYAVPHNHNDDDDESEDDDDDEEDGDRDDEVGGGASSAYTVGTPRRRPLNLTADDLEAANVWSDSAQKERTKEATSTIGGPPSTAIQIDRGARIVSMANEALAEQGAALCHLQSGNLRFLCPVSSEVDPLIPHAFLRAFIAILQEYLAQSSDPTALTEDLIRENFDIVYQLFEEILDKDGNVLTTEVNTLKSLVLPPSWVDKIVKAVGVGGLASAAPPPMVSAIPWRRTHTKYTNNEFYVDLVESLEGIFDRHGRPVALDLWASLECTSKLSGTPELSLSFNTPRMVQDVAFHPCVRHRTWTRDRVLSFIPPDGAFELASFRIGDPHAVPLPPGPSSSTAPAPRPTIASPCNGWAKSLPISMLASFSTAPAPKGSTSTASTFSVQISSLLPPSQALEDVEVTFGLGAGTQSVDASIGGGTASISSPSNPSASNQGTLAPLGTSTSLTRSGSGGGGGGSSAQPPAGTFLFDPTEKVLRWRLPRVSSESRPPLLTGSWQSCDHPPRPSALEVTFSVAMHTVSGLKVTRLEVGNEAYRPFKGVRSMVRGRVQWRV